MSPMHRGEKQIFNAPRKACYFFEDKLEGKDQGNLYQDTTEYENYMANVSNFMLQK